jgi:hypothetical protein
MFESYAGASTSDDRDEQPPYPPIDGDFSARGGRRNPRFSIAETPQKRNKTRVSLDLSQIDSMSPKEFR